MIEKERLLILLDGYGEGLKLYKRFSSFQYELEVIEFHRKMCVDEFKKMIDSVDNGFKGTYEDWVILEEELDKQFKK